jgi:hypothetical protein
MKKAAEILKYAQQYHATKQFHINYRKSKNPDEYLRRYESKLILHDGAKNVLKRYGVNIKNLDIGQLKNDFHEMELKRQNYRKLSNLLKMKPLKWRRNFKTSTATLDWKKNTSVQQKTHPTSY